MKLLVIISAYYSKFNKMSFKDKLIWYFSSFGTIYCLLILFDFYLFSVEILIGTLLIFVIPNIFSLYVHHNIKISNNTIPRFIKFLKNIPMVLYLIYLFSLMCILPFVENIYEPFIQNIMFAFPTFFGHYSPNSFGQSISNIIPMLILLIPFWSFFNLIWHTVFKRIYHK